MSDLKTRMLACAEQWMADCDAPASRLGKAVAGDANCIDRLIAGGGLNLATLEKFAAFFGDPGNWPDGAVPQVARDFVHRVNGTPVEVAASTGQAGEISRDAEGAPC